MKQRVFNLIILDESGSMSSIERQAVDGVNETIQTIRSAQRKHKEQDHIVSLVTFNSDGVKTVYDKVSAEETGSFTADMYSPACCTPLYDAMGVALTSLRKSVADNDAVLVTVITDGEENASREYDASHIKDLVESLKSKGWLFTYIGANQDVGKVAATISITNTLSFSADEQGTKAMFERESAARSRWADCLSCNPCMKAADYDYFDGQD